MQEVNINKIKPNPNNPRTVKDYRFKQLVTSLQEFPEMLHKRPLVCVTNQDGTFTVLGGNMRLKAAKEIGLKTLPVMLAELLQQLKFCSSCDSTTYVASKRYGYLDGRHINKIKTDKIKELIGNDKYMKILRWNNQTNTNTLILSIISLLKKYNNYAGCQD